MRSPKATYTKELYLFLFLPFMLFLFLFAMASNQIYSNGLQPTSNDLQPTGELCFELKVWTYSFGDASNARNPQEPLPMRL